MKSETEQNIINKKSSKRKYIILTGLFVLLILAGLTFLFLLWGIKPDPASEAKIREMTSRHLYYKTRSATDPNGMILDLLRNPELAKDPNKLTDEDFLKIEGITLGYPYPTFDQTITSMELCDIILLKKFTNLKSVNIGSVYYPPNKIPRWMSLLGKIGIVNLEERFALDLDPLKKLNNLETLTIHKTKVKNLKVIENLTNIQSLSLNDMTFSNLEYIRKYKNLKYLHIDRTQVSDLEPLRELTNLQELRMSRTEVSNLEPLRKLTNLNLLYINGCNNISDEQVEELREALPNLKIYR